MQVLYYSPTTWSNTDFYRTNGVFPFINHPEIIMRDISHYGQVNEWDLHGGNAIIIQRPCTPIDLALIVLAKRKGLKVIIDYDDDVLNVDSLSPVFVQYQQQREFILECVKQADEVWCSTPAIVESFQKGIVIPNGLNDYMLPSCSSFNSKSNVIVWRGGSSHESDVYENAQSIADMVNNHHELDFYFIGHRFTYLEQRCGDNYNSVEIMPLMQYFQYLKNLQPRAMIFPLCDTLLNRGKSAISWYEASWAGAAYFGNTMLPEFNTVGTIPIEKFDDLIGNNDTLLESHSVSVQNIEKKFLLSEINKLRVNSLLNI